MSGHIIRVGTKVLGVIPRTWTHLSRYEIQGIVLRRRPLLLGGSLPSCALSPHVSSVTYPLTEGEEGRKKEKNKVTCGPAGEPNNPKQSGGKLAPGGSHAPPKCHVKGEEVKTVSARAHGPGSLSYIRFLSFSLFLSFFFFFLHFFLCVCHRARGAHVRF